MNLIATCVIGGSDVGVGTIVGSEVFNLLVIIGGAVLVSPQLPMVVDKPSFTRDASCYMLSILLTYWTLQDGVVKQYEACTLFGCAILYTASVYYTSAIMAIISPKKDEAAAAPAPNKVTMKGVEVEVQIVRHNRLCDSKMHHTDNLLLDVEKEGVICSTIQEDGESADGESEYMVRTKSTRKSFLVVSARQAS